MCIVLWKKNHATAFRNLHFCSLIVACYFSFHSLLGIGQCVRFRCWSRAAIHSSHILWAVLATQDKPLTWLLCSDEGTKCFRIRDDYVHCISTHVTQYFHLSNCYSFENQMCIQWIYQVICISVYLVCKSSKSKVSIVKSKLTLLLMFLLLLYMIN